jgi:hypothetical protein
MAEAAMLDGDFDLFVGERAEIDFLAGEGGVGGSGDEGSYRGHGGKGAKS